MSQRPRIAPIPADFFFADPVRSTMSPVLVAAMTLAYQYSELFRSEGFLTEPQLVTALGQLSAHGCDIASVIRELLALRQLDDVGTGYQLPLLHTFLRRRAHAVAESKRYHESGGRRGKSRGGARSRTAGRHTVEDAEPPVVTYRNRMSTMPPAPSSQDAAHVGAQSAPGWAPKSCADPVPSSDSSSASASFRSDTSTRPVPTSAEGRSRSGLSFESETAEERQTQTPAQGTAPGEERRPAGARRVEYGLSPESQEVLDDLMAEFDSPIARLDPLDRGRLCTRSEYAPPAHIVAQWVDRLPMDQIKADLERYREKAESDSTAVKEHDRRFVCFMKASLGYKFKQIDLRMAAQRAMRAASKRLREQARQREALRAQAASVPAAAQARVYADMAHDDRPTVVKQWEAEQRARRERLERVAKEGEAFLRARQAAKQAEAAHA